MSAPTDDDQPPPPSLLNIPPELCVAIVDVLLAGSDPRSRTAWVSYRSYPNEANIDWDTLAASSASRRTILNLLYATARKPGSVQPNIAELCVDLLWNRLRVKDGDEVAKLDRGISKPAFGAFEKSSKHFSLKPKSGGVLDSLVSLFFGGSKNKSARPAAPSPSPSSALASVPKKLPFFDYASRITHLRIDKCWPRLRAEYVPLVGPRTYGYEPGPSEQDTLASLLKQLGNLEHLTLGYGVNLNTADELFNILRAVNGGTQEGRAKMRGLEILNTDMSPAKRAPGDDQVARVYEELFTILPNLTTVWFPHWSPPDDPDVLFRALERKPTTGLGLGIERMYIILNGYKTEDILKVAKLVVGGENTMPGLIEPSNVYPSRAVSHPKGELREFVLYARPPPSNKEIYNNCNEFMSEIAHVLTDESRALEHLSCHTTMPFASFDPSVTRLRTLPKLTITGGTNTSDQLSPQIPDVLKFAVFLAKFQIEELYLRYINAYISTVDLSVLGSTVASNPHSLLQLRWFSCLGGMWFTNSSGGNLSTAYQPDYVNNDINYRGPPMPPVKVDCPPSFFAWMIYLSSDTIETVEIVDNMGAESHDTPETYMWNDTVTDQILGLVYSRIHAASQGVKTKPVRIKVGSYGFNIVQLERLMDFIVRQAEQNPDAKAAIRIDCDVQSWGWDVKREICVAQRVIKYRRILVRQGKIPPVNIFASFGPVQDNLVAELFRLTIGSEKREDSLELWKEFAEAWRVVRGRGAQMVG